MGRRLVFHQRGRRRGGRRRRGGGQAAEARGRQAACGQGRLVARGGEAAPRASRRRRQGGRRRARRKAGGFDAFQAAAEAQEGRRQGRQGRRRAAGERDNCVQLDARVPVGDAGKRDPRRLGEARRLHPDQRRARALPHLDDQERGPARRRPRRLVPPHQLLHARPVAGQGRAARDRRSHRAARQGLCLRQRGPLPVARAAQAGGGVSHDPGAAQAVARVGGEEGGGGGPRRPGQAREDARPASAAHGRPHHAALHVGQKDDGHVGGALERPAVHVEEARDSGRHVRQHQARAVPALRKRGHGSNPLPPPPRHHDRQEEVQGRAVLHRGRGRLRGAGRGVAEHVRPGRAGRRAA
mmetsp:Transcript_1679/g.5060  ORF Transcript_1679/g.5060 Transcript_1679/m.5060 type:complete len:354 (+) Transcript_1679:1352-2413(+)